MCDAMLSGELLLEVYVSVGTSEYDTSICGDQGVPAVPDARVPHAQ